MFSSWSLGWSLPWHVVNLPGITSSKKKNVEENTFSLLQLSNASIPSVSGRISCLLSPFLCWVFVWLALVQKPMLTVTISVSSYIHQPHCVWKTLFVGVIDHLWLLQSFHLPFSQRSPSLGKMAVCSMYVLFRTDHTTV